MFAPVFANWLGYVADSLVLTVVPFMLHLCIFYMHNITCILTCTYMRLLLQTVQYLRYYYYVQIPHPCQ